jgi:O-antigen/teichoic acid export membrane protein
MTPIVVIGLLLIKPFLIFWVGAALGAKSALVGQILLPGIWANTLAFIPFTYLQGRGRPDLPAKFHLLELLPYIGILWVLVDLLGVPGAAWAWDLRILADTLLLFWAAGSISTLSYIMLGTLPIAGALFVALKTPCDSALYVGLAIILAFSSIGLSVVITPQIQRTAILRRLTLRPRSVK